MPNIQAYHAYYYLRASEWEERGRKEKGRKERLTKLAQVRFNTFLTKPLTKD